MMISYIRGELVYIGNDSIIVDNNGIGYNIGISSNTLTRLPHINETVKIFTYMNVKEDGITLFGFISREELDMFNMLIGVNGVGPKGALAVLSVLSPAEIALAVASNDIKTLSSGKGVGKKMAERIALELRDKVAKTESAEFGDINISVAEDSSERADALAGLLVLGYSRTEAAKAVDKVYKDGMTSGDIIKLALKTLY